MDFQHSIVYRTKINKLASRKKSNRQAKADDLKNYIDRKFLKSRLDSALLFFSSSLSLAFGVGYAYLGTTWLRYYLPMLLLGWFMPVYIGYIRGSLIEDSIEERIRGWIYLVFGLTLYVCSPMWMNFVNSLKLDVQYAILLMTPVSILPYFVASRVPSVLYFRVFRIQERQLKEANNAFRKTVLSAILLSMTLGNLSNRNWSTVYSKPDLVSILLETILILIIVFLFVLVAFTERKARRLLKEAQLALEQ